MKDDINKHVVTGEGGKNPSVFDYLRLKGEFSYPTESVEVYSRSIAKMNLGDLQTHAMDKGIKPSGDRRRLESALISQFKQVVAKRSAAKMSNKFTADQIKKMEEKRKKSIERSAGLRVLS